MLELITRGVGLGFSAAGTPGPLQTYLMNATLAFGWRRSFPIVFSPLITDIPIALLCLTVLRVLHPTMLEGIRIIGGLFVLWLARGIWLDLLRPTTAIKSDENSPLLSPAAVLRRALTVNMLSPGPYLFWATINGPLLIQGLNQSLAHGLAFLLSFYLVFLGLLALMVALFDRMRRLDDRVTRGLLIASAIIMTLLGISLVYQGMTELLITPLKTLTEPL